MADNLDKRLSRIEKKLANIEGHLGVEPSDTDMDDEHPTDHTEPDEDDMAIPGTKPKRESMSIPTRGGRKQAPFMKER